jgi:hypothetical protein
MTCNTRLRVNRAILRRAVYAIFGGLATALLTLTPAPAAQLAANAAMEHNPEQPASDSGEANLTPEQKMQRRFPQPVRIGHLIGLPVLDDYDSTIGYVKQVVRSPTGKVFLIVPYSAWFGWAHTEWGKRPVAVPIEVVTLLARQLDSVDMSRNDFDEAPTWMPAREQTIPSDEKILIALGRR